ncbi:MAG: hypothetical protein PF637_11450 [Spirochaetes bacterium]|nr:hypothetical protein [Spirochaetota bacterium]
MGFVKLPMTSNRKIGNPISQSLVNLFEVMATSHIPETLYGVAPSLEGGGHDIPSQKYETIPPYTCEHKKHFTKLNDRLII